MRTTENVACLSANLSPAKLFPCRKFHGMYRPEPSTVKGRIRTFASLSLFASRGGKMTRAERRFIDPTRPKVEQHFPYKLL